MAWSYHDDGEGAGLMTDGLRRGVSTTNERAAHLMPASCRAAAEGNRRLQTSPRGWRRAVSDKDMVQTRVRVFRFHAFVFIVYTFVMYDCPSGCIARRAA
ncbi:hypothetical protein VTH06DRAFT_6961 [Thermothelomyces fergusii]